VEVPFKRHEGRQAHFVFTSSQRSIQTRILAALERDRNVVICCGSATTAAALGEVIVKMFPHLKVALLIGDSTAEERREILDPLRRGDAELVNVFIYTSLLSVGNSITVRHFHECFVLPSAYGELWEETYAQMMERVRVLCAEADEMAVTVLWAPGVVDPSDTMRHSRWNHEEVPASVGNDNVFLSARTVEKALKELRGTPHAGQVYYSRSTFKAWVFKKGPLGGWKGTGVEEEDVDESFFSIRSSRRKHPPRWRCARARPRSRLATHHLPACASS
jgi:hypothetical protein